MVRLKIKKIFSEGKKLEEKTIAIGAVEQLLKKGGASRVAKPAARRLAKNLEESALVLAKEARRLAEHAGRKTITERDVRLAKKNLA